MDTDYQASIRSATEAYEKWLDEHAGKFADPEIEFQAQILGNHLRGLCRRVNSPTARNGTLFMARLLEEMMFGEALGGDSSEFPFVDSDAPSSCIRDHGDRGGGLNPTLLALLAKFRTF
jgi:hypothetical protein